MNSIETKSATRPDKTMYFAMMGVFFVLFSLPAFYWANYNFGQYSKTTVFIGDLQKKSDSDLTPMEQEERIERISFSNSRADLFLLEMTLSSAGGLILLGIALIFLMRAWRTRKRRNLFEIVNLQTIPLPTEPITVRYKLIYDIFLSAVVVFLGGLLLLILYQNFTSQSITFGNAVIRSLIFVVPVLLIFSLISFLLVRAKRNAIRLIDNSGITRGDRKTFSWNEFCGVITQVDLNQLTQRKYVWRIELAFENGETAWLIPHRVKNHDEVFNYLAALPRAVLK